VKGIEMSGQKFFQFDFPCKQCVVASICKEKPDNAKDLILKFEDPVLCLTIPKEADQVTYHKMLLECWANMGSEILNKVQKQSSVDYKKEINNNIPRDYLYLMGRMASILAYMVNSTSWEIGETKSFDHNEINGRLENLKLQV
jgi:hypothetical protein